MRQVDAKKAATILIVIGVVYAIAPDLLPGPIDDIVVNAITILLAAALNKLQDKAEQIIQNKVDKGEIKEEHAEKMKSTVSTINTTVKNETTKKLSGF